MAGACSGGFTASLENPGILQHTKIYNLELSHYKESTTIYTAKNRKLFLKTITSVAAVSGIVYSYRKLRGILGKNVTTMNLPNFRKEKHSAYT